MTYGIWSVFIDLALAGGLLLIGQFLRAKVGLLQRLFLPASIIAGFIGLALGPAAADILPFSDSFTKYPGIFIGIIFASLPFAAKNSTADIGKVFSLFSYSSFIIFLQWGLGILFTLYVLKQIWPDLHEGFGSIIAVGFIGGHGTAAAVGEAFKALGWEEATSLAMTSATIGILSAIIGGIIWIKWASRTGNVANIKSFESLPKQMKTGLITKRNQSNSVSETTETSVIDSFTLHLAILFAVLGLGYYANVLNKQFLPDLVVPIFCNCFIIAFVIKRFIKGKNLDQFINPTTMGKFGGSFTDLLIVFGISAIKITVVIKYAVPLLMLFVLGILICAVSLCYFGPRFFDKHWFEKSLFTWGWVTGVSAMAIALLRIVDSKNQSKALEQFAIAYLFIIFFELALVAFAPSLITAGNALYLAIGNIVAAIVIYKIRNRVK